MQATREGKWTDGIPLLIARSLLRVNLENTRTQDTAFLRGQRLGCLGGQMAFIREQAMVCVPKMLS